MQKYNITLTYSFFNIQANDEEGAEVLAYGMMDNVQPRVNVEEQED